RARQDAAGQRPRHAGRGGKGGRQNAERSGRERGERPRLERIGRPANGGGGVCLRGGGGWGPGVRLRVVLGGAPPRTPRSPGGRGSKVVAQATDAAVMAVSVAAPSCVLLAASRPSSATQWRKALRSSDLGGGLEKKGCVSTRATASSSTLPAAAVRPSSSCG